MKKALVIAAVVLAAAAAGGASWWSSHRHRDADGLVLYGNLDLRQIDLAFHGSQRIERIVVEEGDRVRTGQVLATMETQRLEAAVAQAEAQVQAQRHVVERLENGARPEEIDQAKANLAAAEADVVRTRQDYERLSSLRANAAGAQEVANARAALEVANAQARMKREALNLALAGPRREEKAEAKARLRAQEAQLALARRELADATLAAPAEGVIRNRILQPGEMASPQRPVLSLAVTSPKWVRAYVNEPGLGRVRPGQGAAVAVDSFPGRRFEGWVGFVSPVAEFTPKNVETPELRTSLVYEVRVFVTDPDDLLRLGQPATVYLNDLNREGAKSAKADAKKRKD